MFWLMLSTVLLAIWLIVVLASIGGVIFSSDPEVRAGWAVAGGLAFMVFLVHGFFASTAFVDAKNVAVITRFGAAVDTEQSGLAWKKPWEGAVELDGTVQTDEYRDDSGDDGCGGAIYVRIGDGSRSCLTTTIRWRINLEAADDVYADYRSNDPTDQLRSAVVSTQFKAAAQAVLAEYNPIASLQVVDGDNAEQAAALNFAPDYDQVAADLSAQMEERLGDDPLVDIISVSVSYVSLAKTTQAKLDDFIAAVGDTRIAAQRRSTATQEALANKELESSVTPETLRSKCLDLVAEAIKVDYGFNAGWTCGDAGALVLPAAGSSK